MSITEINDKIFAELILLNWLISYLVQLSFNLTRGLQVVSFCCYSLVSLHDFPTATTAFAIFKDNSVMHAGH